MQGPQSFTLENDEVTLHYRVFGEGFPILLLSGGPGGSSDELLSVANRLEKAGRVILLDQRGTGKSKLKTLDTTTINLAAYVEDVEVVRRHLGIDTWVILGHSWGGTLAMAVAARYPQHVAGMILIESGGINLDFLEQVPTNMRHTEEDQAALKYWSDPDRVAADPQRAAYESYKVWVSGTVYDRGNVAKAMEHFRPEPHTNTIAGLMMKNLMAANYDLRDALSSFTSPVLIVQGKPGLMGASTAEQIHASLPNSALVFVEKCGHYPMFEQPKQFYATVEDFLDEHFRAQD